MRFTTFILKNLLRRPVRSVLTGAGVALAVGAVVSLMGIAAGFEQSFVQLLEGRQIDLVVCRAGVTERLTSSLPEDVAHRIRRLPGVIAVAGGLMDVVSFREADLIGVPIQGLPADSFLFANLEIEGRKFAPGDRRVALLGAMLAKNLGKKVGDALDIETDRFQIVGIYRSFNVFENGSVIVPLAELQKLMDRPGQVTAFQVAVNQTLPDRAALIDRVRRGIEALTDDEGRRLRLEAMPAHDYVKSTVQILQARAMAWVTSVIALVIGSIGMLNTMIMSVFERTREIGVLRAIGWRRRRIVGMVLGESLTLCVAGAVAGAAGAALFTRWLASMPAASGYIQGTIPGTVLIDGFAVALVVGLIGGAYPAYRGASLAPTDAIRHE